MERSRHLIGLAGVEEGKVRDVVQGRGKVMAGCILVAAAPLFVVVIKFPSNKLLFDAGVSE